MANRGKIQGPAFKYFDWSENPKDKYKQPEKAEGPRGSGYPQSDIGKDGVFVKGKYPANTPMKKYGKARGQGAAERGDNFIVDGRVYGRDDE